MDAPRPCEIIKWASQCGCRPLNVIYIRKLQESSGAHQPGSKQQHAVNNGWQVSPTCTSSRVKHVQQIAFQLKQLLVGNTQEIVTVNCRVERAWETVGCSLTSVGRWKLGQATTRSAWPIAMSAAVVPLSSKLPTNNTPTTGFLPVPQQHKFSKQLYVCVFVSVMCLFIWKYEPNMH